MMPLPTFIYPAYEERPRLPAETRQALRWEGIVGTLPVGQRLSWLARLRVGIRAARDARTESPSPTRADLALPSLAQPSRMPPSRAEMPPAIAPTWLLHKPAQHEFWLEDDDEAMASLQRTYNALLHLPRH